MPCFPNLAITSASDNSSVRSQISGQAHRSTSERVPGEPLVHSSELKTEASCATLKYEFQPLSRSDAVFPDQRSILIGKPFAQVQMRCWDGF